MDYKAMLDDFLSTCSGKVRNVFFEIYSIIDGLDESEKLPAFIYVCNNVFSSTSDYSKEIKKEYYTEKQTEIAERKINTKFTPAFEALLENCIKNEVEAEEFYSHLWSLLQSSIFQTKRERALAVFYIVDHDLIPYRNVGTGLSMEEGQYQAVLDKLDDDLLKDTDYILKCDYEQKTQPASLLVDHLLSLQTKEEQAVYMSIILNRLKKNIKEKINTAVEKI